MEFALHEDEEDTSGATLALSLCESKEAARQAALDESARIADDILSDTRQDVLGQVDAGARAALLARLRELADELEAEIA